MQTKASILKLTATCVALLGLASATANAQLTLHLVANPATTGAAALGDPVATWTGSGATTISVSQGTADQQPTFNPTGVNGLGFVSFDGANDNLRATGVDASFLPASGNATVMVLRPGDLASESAASWGTALANMWQLSLINPDIHYVQGDISGVDQQVFGAAPGNWVDSWHVVTGIRNADGSGELRVDGATIATAGAGTFAGPNPSGTGTLVIGGSDFDGANDRWAGDIAEIRVYSTVPNIATEEGALFTAYNITPVPEPSEYAMIFGLACVAGAVALRYRRQQLAS